MVLTEFQLEYFCRGPDLFSPEFPLHTAASEGRIDIFQMIMEKAEDKNPADQDGATPLHHAAAWGHFDICLLIMEQVEDKNPADARGWTPLHDASSGGHDDICQLIMENVDEKNPMDITGRTPRDVATSTRFKSITTEFSKLRALKNVLELCTGMPTWW